MEVLLVNNQWRLGGAETVIRQLLSRIPNTRLLVAESYSPTIDVMYPRLLSRLSHTRLHSMVEGWFPLFEWTNRRFSQLSADAADIIHLHNFHGFYASIEALGALARAKRVVWTFHGLWGVTGGCDHPKGCRRFLNACGDCPQLGLWPIGDIDRTSEQLSRKMQALAGAPLCIIAPSKYVLSAIRESRVGRNWKLYHVPNGINSRRFTPRQNFGKKLKLLVVNRNFKDPQKGFETIKETLCGIDQREFEVTLVGSNSDWAAKALKRGIEARNVEYLYNQETLARLYGESEIFLFASPAENFPCVILEAMAAGCCVVATPSGGVVEQISHEETGFLASKISGDSLAEALSAVLTDRSKIKEVGLRARRAVIERFSEDRMIEIHQKIYQSMMREGVGGDVQGRL
jgi:glycosyltransferase involved in cell wall biosynthesis